MALEARHRLAFQIQVTIVAVLLLFGLLVGLAWVAFPDPSPLRLADGVGDLLTDILPGPTLPRAELQERLDRVARRLPFDIAAFGSDGERLAETTQGIPSPAFDRTESHWIHAGKRLLTMALRLRDGRWIVVRHRDPPSARIAGFLLVVALLFVTTATASYPLVRRITGRLERLRERVEQLGRGDLASRVAVEGADEIGDLARSFNLSAERIEALVLTQRRILAGASHELRSPLARLRMALELLQGDAGLRAHAVRDIAELDGLIDELLAASRLDAQPELARRDDVDLLGLVAEEAARTGADVDGESVVLSGDARLLRRLVRNLLENARRHASGHSVEVSVTRALDRATLTVADRGPGVSEAERERIFEPFYRPTGAPETGDGWGLGLALVRQIARAHGGEARCRPREGGGTMFEVDLLTPTS